jgi:hypothetical protein
MLTHTLHQREVLGHDTKDAFEFQPEVTTIYQLHDNGRWFSPGTPYTTTTLSKDESIDYHMSVLSSCGISMNNDDCKLFWLYWIP